MSKFVQNIVSFSLKNHLFIFFMTGVLIFAGIISYLNTPIEAFPDVTNTRVRIITQWSGRSAEEVEKFVTLPVSKVMNTIPHKTDVRSISLFGLSVVTVLFEDKVEDFYAQQYASARIGSVNLPEGAEPSIEPPSGATGEIFRYVIRGEGYPIHELSALQEWVIERELLAVPGIADVVTFGGKEKIYEIQTDPNLLASFDLSPLDVYTAVSNSNINVGGDVIRKGVQAYAVRGIGLLESIEDIENIMVKTMDGTPVLVKHVAEVVISSKPRLGQVGLDDEDDLVQGIVIMLRGENPSEVISKLKLAIDELNERILPPGVRVEAFHDRTHLVNETVRTVTINLLEGFILISVIVFIFLYNWKTTLIVALIIPLAFLFAIIMLRVQGLPANLISMGAIDFGLLLKGVLIIVESVFVELDRKAREVGMPRFNKLAKSSIIKKGAGKVAKSIFFAQLILIIALVPIFSFQKVEGKLFSPLAFTLGYALLGSLILSLTLVPALCKVLLTKNIADRHNKFSSAVKEGIYSVFRLAFANRKIVLPSFLVLVALCALGFGKLGSEFIPRLNEGAIYVRATLPNSVHLEEAVRLTKQMKNKIRQIEEVEFVLTQTGRPNDGTDPTGFFNIEFHIQLKDRKEWPRKVTTDELLEEMEAVLAVYPGVSFTFSQPIMDNVEEFVSGVKSSLVIKIFGDDLFELERLADDVAGAIHDVEGIEDLNVFRNIGLPELRIRLDEERMARHGIYMAEAQAVIEMAIGGKSASSFYEDERIFDIRIRFMEEYRKTDLEIANILIPASEGYRIPLGEIADISYITGPAFIYREGSSRYIAIGFSIRGRDMGSTISEAREKVDNMVTLPPSYTMTWAGEFENKERATSQLARIVPISLLIILFLLYANFGNFRDTLITLSTLLYAYIGGFMSLWITGTIFGITAGIGFIILFGVTTVAGIILIASIKENLHRKMPLKEAIFKGVYEHIRPIVMIALMGSAGLFPAALSTGMGSEIQKPLAVIIVGGLLIAMFLAIIILPQFLYLAYKKKSRK